MSNLKMVSVITITIAFGFDFREGRWKCSPESACPNTSVIQMPSGDLNELLALSLKRPMVTVHRWGVLISAILECAVKVGRLAISA